MTNEEIERMVEECTNFLRMGGKGDWPISWDKPTILKPIVRFVLTNELVLHPKTPYDSIRRNILTKRIRLMGDLYDYETWRRNLG